MYCGAPPPPPSLNTHVGTTSWSTVPVNFTAAYGYNVTYTCGPAKQFHSVLNDVPPHSQEVRTCMWDGSWYPNSVSPVPEASGHQYYFLTWFISLSL